MPDIDPVLAAIDGALADYTVSGDAMRWTPEPVEPKGPVLSLDEGQLWFAPVGTPPPLPPPGSMLLSGGPAEGCVVPFPGSAPPSEYVVATAPPMQFRWDDDVDPMEPVLPVRVRYRRATYTAPWVMVYAP